MNIEVRNLNETLSRYQAYPQKMRAALSALMEAILLKIWELVPSYPPPPEGSSYRRTGTLGRSLGVSESGAKVGTPDIYETREMGSGLYQARFGSNLEYAPYVIGDPATEQALHMRHWWTLPKTVAWLAEKAVTGLAQAAIDVMADWLNGR
jgi:hypothetical protein